MLQPALEEQRRILKQHGDHIDVDVLNEMDVLHSNMTEVLRLFPPLILLMRMVKKSFIVTDSKGRQTVIPKVNWHVCMGSWYVKGCRADCQQRQSGCLYKLSHAQCSLQEVVAAQRTEASLGYWQICIQPHQ